eukprot:4584117-Pyramimonas_sp.AAC.1
MLCNLCGATGFGRLGVVSSTARVICPPIRSQLGLQNPCGGECDLVCACLRPRYPAHARAHSGQL